MYTCCDDLRVSKSWATFHFGVNYPFNIIGQYIHFTQQGEPNLTKIRLLKIKPKAKSINRLFNVVKHYVYISLINIQSIA